MSKFLKHIFITISFVLLATWSTKAQNQKKDSITVKKDSIDLRYQFKKNQTGGLFLDYLAKKEIIFDNDHFRAYFICRPDGASGIPGHSKR